MDSQQILVQSRLNRLYPETQGRPDLVIGIIDGVIDGGHPDLRDSNIRVINGSTSLQAPVCENPDSPSCQHGTLVAGIIAAQRKSEALGIAPQCQFVSHQIFCEANSLEDCPRVKQEDLARAVSDCIDNGARIINMSLGVDSHTEALSDVLARQYDHAQQQDVLLIAAAGNQGINQVNPLFKHPWIISVSATNNEGKILPSSNSGDWLAQFGLRAPGSSITSTASGGGYQKMTGTSAAAAYVTGTAALLWSLAPEISAAQLRLAMLQQSPHLNERAFTPSHHSVLKRSQPLFINAEQSLQLIQQWKAATMQEPASPNVEGASTHKNADTSEPQITMQSGKPVDRSSTPLIPTPVEGGRDTDAITSNVQAIDSAEQQNAIQPQDCGCGAQNEVKIYAVGILSVQYSNRGLQRTYESTAEALNLGDNDFFQVLSFTDSQGNQPNLYLAQQATWILNIADEKAYRVIPQSLQQLQQFIQALKPAPDTLQDNYSTVIGLSATDIIDAETQLPTVECTESFSHTLDQLLGFLKSASGADADTIRQTIELLAYHPNMGNTDFQRAKNYIAFRYPEIYQFNNNQPNKGYDTSGYFLKAITTNYADLLAHQTVVDVNFEFQANNSPLKQYYFCSVDVTGEFPFVIAPIQRFTPTFASAL